MNKEHQFEVVAKVAMQLGLVKRNPTSSEFCLMRLAKQQYGLSVSQYAICYDHTRTFLAKVNTLDTIRRIRNTKHKCAA